MPAWTPPPNPLPQGEGGVFLLFLASVTRDPSMAPHRAHTRRPVRRADRAARLPPRRQRAVRQRRGGGDAARAGDPVHRAESRLQLSRPARQPGEPPRQPRAADAAVPARGARGGDRARLRQGDRQADGRRGACQCRADARQHGDVQRLVRPRAGDRAGRHRPGRCAEAAALDRLDPHRARPGRAGAALHQMGRPAGLGRSGARVAAARRLAGHHRRRWGRSM